MDQAESSSLHEGNACAQRPQQADESSLHERVHEEVEGGSLEIVTLEVDCEALDVELAQQELREEVDDQKVDGEETRLQVFAVKETSLVLKDERSS
jgi:hypothetical protein